MIPQWSLQCLNITQYFHHICIDSSYRLTWYEVQYWSGLWALAMDRKCKFLVGQDVITSNNDLRKCIMPLLKSIIIFTGLENAAFEKKSFMSFEIFNVVSKMDYAIIEQLWCSRVGYQWQCSSFRVHITLEVGDSTFSPRN